MNQPARKRLVKQSKLHFLDSGLACWMLGIRAETLEEDRPVEVRVVYGGDEPQRRDRATLVPWWQIADHDWV